MFLNIEYLRSSVFVWGPWLQGDFFTPLLPSRIGEYLGGTGAKKPRAIRRK